MNFDTNNNNFNIMIKNKSLCDKLIDYIMLSHKNLTELYSLLYKNLDTTNLYLGIDSFNFQNKLLELQITSIKRFFNIIINRIYCDYYKIHRSIKKYTETTFSNIELINNIFPIYKDLEIEKIYDFNIITDLRSNIFYYINSINNYINIKINDTIEYIDTYNNGLYVKNYINEENNLINTYKEQLNLYVNYIDTCTEYHLKYFNKIIKQINFIKESLDEEIMNNLNNIKNIEDTKIINNVEDVNIKNIEEDNKIVNNVEDININNLFLFK